MKFIQATHRDLGPLEALWREEDGACRIWIRREQLSYQPFHSDEAVIVLEHQEKKDVDWSYAYRAVGSELAVRPFGLGVFVLADMLQVLSEVPRTATYDLLLSRHQKLIFSYGRKIIRPKLVITVKHIQHRQKTHSKRALPVSQADPDAVVGTWTMKEGTVIRVGDLHERHLRNIVKYAVNHMRTYNRGGAGRNVLYENEPAVVKEAVRRGLIKSLKDEVDKAEARR